MINDETAYILPYYKEILNSIPDSIDFDFIPVKTVSTREILLETKSDISIYFKIENAEKYTFSPNEGILQKNKPQKILIQIEPTDASVVISNAQIVLDNRLNKIIKLSSVAKYPYLSLNKTHFDLGIVEYGKSSSGEIIITNSEQVPAQFKIIQSSLQPGKHPQIFTFSKVEGEIPPNNSFLVNINFTPFFSKSITYETYILKTKGGNNINFSLTGECTPLKIYLSSRHISFGTIELGKSTTKLIRVYNDSDMETDYQIMHSNGSSVFFIKDNEVQGTVRPHTNIRVNVSFKPNQTTLFYERVFVIAKNHSVFPLDLYGSCHDLLNKTVLLNQKYIEMFRSKLLIGEFFNPEGKPISNKTILDFNKEIRLKENNPSNKNNSNINNMKIDINNNNIISRNSSKKNNNLSTFMKSDSLTGTQLQIQKEILWESTSPNRLLSFSTDHIDFNFVGIGETSQPFILSVKNNSNMELKVKWVLDRPIITSNLIQTTNLFQNENSIFIIQPEEVIITPHNINSFKVYFKPNKDEDYFYHDIPCLATVMDNNFNDFKIGLLLNQNNNVYNQTTMGFSEMNNQSHLQIDNNNNNTFYNNTNYNFNNSKCKPKLDIDSSNLNNKNNNLNFNTINNNLRNRNNLYSNNTLPNKKLGSTIYNMKSGGGALTQRNKMLKPLTLSKTSANPCNTICGFGINAKNTINQSPNNKILNNVRSSSNANFNSNNNNNKNSYGQNLKFQILNRTTSNFGGGSQKKIGVLKNLFEKNPKIRQLKPLDCGYFNPPFCTYLSVVGHSFPPGNQLYIPMFEFEPKKEIMFPYTSINQSQFQIFKITNKSDTPLFYSINKDNNFTIFKVARRHGLIPAHQFHLILIEFSPNETTTYRYPLKIILNHDLSNVKTIILNGLCVDPVIELEGIKNDIYFPPSFIGITTTKKISIINRAPINIHVSALLEKNEGGDIVISPSEFDMEANLIKPISISFTPKTNCDFKTKITFKVERNYDNQKDIIGVYNPCSLLSKDALEKDRREYIKEIFLIGKGNDGELKIEPSLIEFGTVKVGFHKKMSFSIYNPTMTNFYIKLVKKFYQTQFIESKEKLSDNEINNYNNNNNKNNKENKNEIMNIDFKEGLINSFCKKEVNILFKPINRHPLKMEINIFAIEHNPLSSLKTNTISSTIDQNNNNINNNFEVNPPILEQKPSSKELLKHFDSKLLVIANGDYPLIQIADVRNDQVGTNNLWHLFNVDKANEELHKQLTEEERIYIGQERAEKKIDDYKSKLKCITFNLGKHVRKKNFDSNNINYNKKKQQDSFTDYYVTLRNDGEVHTEFYFKFPGEISVLREIWMDPVEPSSSDKFEYHVLKEKIFELEPKRGKLNPGESCNIRFRYNYKEKGNHHLHVIFQVVNGKPLILKLNAVCFGERQGMLEIKRPLVNFNYVPIGYMNYSVCPLELMNVGGVKIRYKIDKKQIDNFNKNNDNFEIFKIDSLEGNIGPGDMRYIPIFFRPLTDKEYKLNIDVLYFTESILSPNITNKDDQQENNSNNHNNNINLINNEKTEKIVVEIKGMGYHPMIFVPPVAISPFAKMPKNRVCNTFNNEIIQKCGLSVEEIDFGECEEGVPKNETFIIYNFSKTNSFNFEFSEPGFILKDEIIIKPNNEKLKPNSHKIIKIVLIPGSYVSNYDGELDVKINWETSANNNISPTNSNLNLMNNNNNNNNNNDNFSDIKLAKEVLHIRIRKIAIHKDSPSTVGKPVNKNQCFVESLLSDLTREILAEKSFEDLFKDIDNQPMGIFDWIDDISYPSQGDVREIIQKNLQEEIKAKTQADTVKMFSHIFNQQFFKENSSNNNNNNANALNVSISKRGGGRTATIHDGSKMLVRNSNKNLANPNDNNNILQDPFSRNADLQIQEKYMYELIQKYKLTIPEVNENLAMVNEDSRKLISNDIMESTVYNIISEAVYGEADLSQKTRIYFFK